MIVTLLEARGMIFFQIKEMAMKLSSFLAVNSVILVFFGIGFIAMPATMTSLYGVELSAMGLLVGQLLGAAFLGFGILRWHARKTKPGPLLSALVLAGLVEDVIGFVVLLMAQTAGLMNVMGWSNVLLYGIFALGFGYFHFSNES
jgi:hypothetical protein